MLSKTKSRLKYAIGRIYLIAIVIVIIIIIAVGAYAAVSSGTTKTSSSSSMTTTASSYKNTIILGTTDSVQTTIDPADEYDYFGGEMVNNLGAPLVDFAAGTNDTSPSALQPALATSWSVSSDGLTYTFILRSGVKYDDNTPFNATCVKYSFDRALQLNDPNGAWVGLGIAQIVKQVTVVNNTAVQFTLFAPWTPFLSFLTFSAAYIVDPARAPMNEVVNYTTSSPQISNPNGLGPYTLTEWTRQGSSDTEMTLKANPNYFAAGTLPKTQTIIIKFYTSATALAAAVEAGDVDIAYRQFLSTDIKTMQTQYSSSLNVFSSPGAFIQYLVLNNNIAPFNNIYAREAIAAAINRTDLIDTVFLGTASPLYSQVPLGMFSHIDAFKTMYGASPNTSLIQQLLGKAGYSASNPLSFNFYYETSGHYPQSPDQAQVIQSDLQKDSGGWIKVNLMGLTWASMHSTVATGTTAQMFLYGWYPDFIDPYDYTFPFFNGAGNSWLHAGYNSSQMNELTNSALTTSASAAGTLYGQIQTLQAHDAPIVPLFQGGANCCGAVAKKSVSGVYLDVTLIFRLYMLREAS